VSATSVLLEGRVELSSWVTSRRCLVEVCSRSSMSIARVGEEERSTGVIILAELPRRLAPWAYRSTDAKIILWRSVMWWCRVGRDFFGRGRQLEDHVVAATKPVARSVRLTAAWVCGISLGGRTSVVSNAF
jgi:hypothetical protein